MSGGIASTVAARSADVGASGVAPGTAMILAIVLTMLDDVTTSSRDSASSVNSWTTSATGSARMLLDSTRMPSVDEKPVSSSSVSTSATVWLSWSIQRSGSDSILKLPSNAMPPMNSAIEAMTSGIAEADGSEPSFTTTRSTSDSPRAPVGTRYSRMPSTAVGMTMPTATSTTMPMASITPKSRIIGTCETWSARNATTPLMVATMSAGARLACVSDIGCAAWSRTTSSSTRLWIWMAKSMPRPMRIGRPEIVTSERSTSMNPSRANDHATPMRTERSGSRRHRTRNSSRSTIAMTASAAAPSVSMPPCR